MIQQFHVRNAKVFVHVNQICTIYLGGVVKIDLSTNKGKCEAAEFGRGHPSEILISDKSALFERVQVFRCLRGQNVAL